MEYKTSVFYAGGGSEYTFPFEYLQKSFVKVRYQKPDGAFQNLEFGKDYNVEENRVTLTTASDSADKVNIYRSTPTDRMVKYVDASILKAHDMNVNELQTLHIMEEQTDYLSAYALFRGDNANVWEANTLRIINLAAPLEPTDAVNKAYVDEYGVSWNQNVAQMKQQLQEQNTNIATQLDTQNKAVTKQLSAQQTAIDTQLKNQSDDFENRISTHDTELLNKVDANNQKYKTDLETYNNKIVQHIHDDAGASAELSKKWAQDKGSPDNASDSVSSTGKTQSSKTWAGVAKSQAQASAASAAAALASQKAAKTSETNAKTSETNANTYSSAALASQNAAKTSETNAKTSEENAAESARQAAAGQINSDWNETDESSQAFIKNKPNVVTKTELANSVSTKDLSVTGETSVPTANAGNSSKAIANTEFVQGELTNYLPLRGGTLTGVVNGVTPTAGDNSTKIATTEFVNAKAGLPVGFEAFTTNPNLQAGWLPLLGGEYSRETYADLWAWVQTQSGYLIEESAWQAKAASNGGNVPFYSKGDGSTTFRVPALKCWVRGANSINEVGGYLAAGLPNITGQLQLRNGNNVGFELNNHNEINGAFSAADSTRVTSYAEQFDYGQPLFAPRLKFSAHDSSSIYGNSATVQPESIVGMWVVKAYGTVTNVGSTDVSAIAQGLTEAETRISTAALTGVVQAFAGRTMPQGWLLCDGSAVSRTDYAALYAVIGTTYGAGNGSTTFNLPNLTDKFIQGSATAGTVKSAGLPNITGQISDSYGNTGDFYDANGAFYLPHGQDQYRFEKVTEDKNRAASEVSIDASRSSSIYGNSTTVQPPALTMKYIIKY